MWIRKKDYESLNDRLKSALKDQERLRQIEDSMFEGTARMLDNGLILFKQESWEKYCSYYKISEEDLTEIKNELEKYKEDSEFWKYKYLKLKERLEQTEDDEK